MNSKAVLEDVRRYRAIASLYRQTAALRPLQRASLLCHAHEWEYRALDALEAYFADRNLSQPTESAANSCFWTHPEMMAAAA